MVQIDALNVDVIKVTIKDKPGLQQLHHEQQQQEEEQQQPRSGDESRLRRAFGALRQHATRERELRQIRTAIETRSSTRRLRQCFASWRNKARQRALQAARKIAQHDDKASKEEKIELLVEAIAERQKHQQQQQQQHSSEKKAKSAPPSASKATSQARTLSGSKTTSRDISSIVAKSRLQAQKRIIEEQRSKLEEQRRVIEEMRLKELDEQAKRTNKETMTMAKQALGQCDQRTRRSILHLMREQGCRDKTLTEIPQIPGNTPTFLLRMEARAEIRKQRIRQTEEIHQRRREEEKRREEIRRKEIEEQERQRQLQALKEAKRQRKELEERRKRELERNQRLEHMADQFYKRYLFRKYALEPLGSFVEQKRNYLQTADQHYGLTLMVKIFAAWKTEYLDQRAEKLRLAAKFYQRNLLWYSFHDWKHFALDMKQKYQVAVDFCEMKLQSKCIRAWFTLHLRIKGEEQQKEMKAKRHHDRRLKEMFFSTWRQYMEIADDVNERERRRDEWRDLIKKFIPNDTPKWKNVTLKS
ncbi:trichohyalin [Phymastichus coffea]|uniref:trichohyalin n=1 Tax=Phymastichus coffea TaxID=108790 RepID=UPI00273ABC1F|nr:trichohyalin [Phymastichus coffea]